MVSHRGETFDTATVDGYCVLDLHTMTFDTQHSFHPVHGCFQRLHHTILRYGEYLVLGYGSRTSHIDFMRVDDLGRCIPSMAMEIPGSHGYAAWLMDTITIIPPRQKALLSVGGE